MMWHVVLDVCRWPWYITVHVHVAGQSIKPGMESIDLEWKYK